MAISLCEAFSMTPGVGSAHRRWNAKRVKLGDRFLLVGTVIRGSALVLGPNRLCEGVGSAHPRKTEEASKPLFAAPATAHNPRRT